MKLKYAWSERRTAVQSQPAADQHFEASNLFPLHSISSFSSFCVPANVYWQDAAENLVDDIFDASMELRTVHSEEIDVSRFSEEYEVDI